MITKNEISGIGIEIESQGVSRFMVLVTSDGNIKRMGTGKMMDITDNLYIGRVDEPVFQKIMKHVDESLLKLIGKQIKLSNPQGIPCKLTISFKIGEMLHQIVIDYGHQSGYPQEIVAIVKAALEETQNWYERTKQTAQSGKNKKRSWPFR